MLVLMTLFIAYVFRKQKVENGAYFLGKRCSSKAGEARAGRAAHPEPPEPSTGNRGDQGQ